MKWFRLCCVLFAICSWSGCLKRGPIIRTEPQHELVGRYLIVDEDTGARRPIRVYRLATLEDE